MRQLIWKGLKNRFVRFASIGLLCLVFVQLPVMLVLMHAGVTVLWAIAAGFVLSTVVNFFLQDRFNFDNEVKGSMVLGLAKFLGTSVFAFFVNVWVAGVVFYDLGGFIPSAAASVRSVGLGMADTWALLAAFIGAVSGTGFNFAASRVFRTFGQSAGIEKGDDETMEIEVPIRDLRPQADKEREQVPYLNEVRATVGGYSLTVFMPAYNEAGNLPTTVGALVKYLHSLGLLDFRVVIINDGSSDNTGKIADRLAKKRYPGEVEVIHHKVNLGYGGALITGFNEAVESGRHLWAFCDSDGQFDPKSFGTLLVALFDDDGEKAADLAVGYRIGRRDSDSAFRFWLGRAWHFFGKYVVGRNAEGNFLLSVHDVDCGIKAGFTKSLARIVEQLQGQAAAISPELIARTNLDCQVIVERGVTHLSRLAGTSTGDNPKVMIRSAVNIVGLGMRFRWERFFGWINNPLADVQQTLLKKGWEQ